MKKYENVDIIASLEAIMRTNTQYYRLDFEYDRVQLREAGENACSDSSKKKTYLWMSRSHGTWCFDEHRVFLRGTGEYNTWLHYGTREPDTILAYAVEVTRMDRGRVMGNLYELDYRQHVRHVENTAHPVSHILLSYENGERELLMEKWNQRGLPDPVYGQFMGYEYCPKDPELFHCILENEQKARMKMNPGDIKEHIAQLSGNLYHNGTRCLEAV